MVFTHLQFNTSLRAGQNLLIRLCNRGKHINHRLARKLCSERIDGTIIRVNDSLSSVDRLTQLQKAECFSLLSRCSHTRTNPYCFASRIRCQID